MSGSMLSTGKKVYNVTENYRKLCPDSTDGEGVIVDVVLILCSNNVNSLNIDRFYYLCGFIC